MKIDSQMIFTSLKYFTFHLRLWFQEFPWFMIFSYQAPGKSKSPIQFGDEDWELAWEENQDDSRTHKPEKSSSAKTKRTAGKNKNETKTDTAEPFKKVKSSEMLTCKRQKRDRNRGSTEEESKSGGTESEKGKNQNESSNRKYLSHDVAVCKKS